jgi:hypothetical protein
VFDYAIDGRGQMLPAAGSARFGVLSALREIRSD